MENTLKILDAIGKQWAMVLILFVIGIFILKWNTIWNLIASISQVKIKRGDTEVEVNKKSSVESKEEKQKITEQIVEKNDEIADKKDKIENKEEDNLNQKYQKELDDRKFSDAKKTFDKILTKESDENKRKLKLINNYYWRSIHGDTKSFDEFEEYLTRVELDNEQKAIVNRNLSRFYEDAGNSKKAIELLHEAIDFTGIVEDKALCVSRISDILYKIEKKDDAIEILFEYLTKLNERKSKFTLYRSIALFYKKEENKMLESIAYQKALENQPNDISLLFDAAYNYSGCDENFKDIGLLLYKRLIYINPKHESSLNNLGVAYKNLELPFKSVSYYKKALDIDSTIAASNLAYLLMDDGFETEAEKYLNDAQEKDDVHDNVFSAASALKSKLSGEKEKEEKIVAKAEKKLRFLTNYGDAAFIKEQFKLKSSENWIYNGNKVNIKIEDNIINISWVKGEEPHSIVGVRNRNAFNLTYKKPKQNYSWQVGKYSFSDHKGYGVLNNGSEIECLFEIEKDIIDFKFSQ